MTLLTLGEYAARHDKSTRTVQRWLEAGALPGAQLVDGRWRIPADVLPMTEGAGTVATSRAPSPTPLATLAGALDVRPAYLDVPTAAELLGISAYAVHARIERYRGERCGDNGAWMIPAAVVREIAGLR